MKALGAITALFLLALLRGFVLVLGWDWFIVPLGVPEIGLAHALGISALCTLLTSELNSKDDKEFGLVCLQSVAIHLFCLFLMFIYKLFM